MQDQSNIPDGRVERLEATVERLTSEVTSLKLELATLVSALRERSFRLPRQAVTVLPPAFEPPRPSVTPAAIVVLAAAGWLSWQLIMSPPSSAAAPPLQAVASTVDPMSVMTVPAAEPPASIVEPTIYKGTLTVAADHPGARVFINHRNVGTAPVRVRNLKAGSHLVWIERDGYRRWTRVVTVPAERVTRVAADLEPIENDY